MPDLSSCFKAYDIRGKAPALLNAHFAYNLGLAIAQILKPATAVIGRDARLSSPMLATALANCLMAANVKVTDIGLCGTEEIYYAAARHDFDIGIMVTGSHNPVDENGFKIVRKGAIPVGLASGLGDIAEAVKGLMARPGDIGQEGKPEKASYRKEYMQWLASHLGGKGKRLRIAVDSGNGCAGPFLQEYAEYFPHQIIGVNFEPDGNFPNGAPNPLLPGLREAASRAVLANRADFGVAFDGDFDRCFFFDHNGQMVESCYLIGHLAKELLEQNPANKGGAIVHDARVYWLTREIVEAAGGRPVMGKGGHTLMKETMRRENALYGAEMSAHHFYRDFAFCDSGMLTFTLMANILANEGANLAELVADGIKRYPCSGEINFRVKNAAATLEKIWRRYAPKAEKTDRLDGINLEFPNWRFNLRSSNTEPVLRLNVEARGDKYLLAEKTEDLKKLISAI